MSQTVQRVGNDAERKSLGSSSARNVLQILFSFSERRVSATVPELAELAGVPVPTAYRHVALLKDLQLLIEGPPGSYHPTVKVMALARAAQLANTLAEVARPVLAEASAAFNETVMLMQYVGDAVVCVEVHETARAMRFTFQRGHSVPLGSGGSGKMALACLPEPARAAALEKLARPELEEEIAQTLARGYAMSVSDLDEGVFACSVPVMPVDGMPVVLTMCGPESRIGQTMRDRVPTQLMAFADGLRQIMSRFAI